MNETKTQFNMAELKSATTEAGATDWMKKLGAKTKDRTSARRMARNKDTIHELMHALKTKPKFSKMVEYSVECLKNLAVDEVSIEEMIEEGVLDTLMAVQKLNPYNEAINSMINKTLATFCINPSMAEKIGKVVGGGPLTLSFKKHVEAETLLSTTALVNKLCVVPANIDAFVQSGMCEAIAGTVKTQSKNEDVVTGCVQNLEKIAEAKDYANKVMETGVMHQVLDCIKNCSENVALMEASVGLIATLARQSPDIAETLKKMGVVDILVAALENNPDALRLLELGSSALSLLAGEQDVASTLKLQAGNNLMTANALAKISSLMLVDENVEFMIQNQGVEWLIAAVNGVIGDQSDIAAKILGSGCRALMRLAQDEHKIYGLMQQGAVKTLISVLQNHSSDIGASTAALGALAKMLTRKENALFIHQSGGTHVAKALAVKHPDDKKVAKTVLEYYAKLANHKDMVKDLIATGAINDIVHFLQKFGSTDPSIAELCVATLALVSPDPAAMKKIAENMGLEAIIDTLNTHADDINIATACVKLLHLAAQDQANLERLRTGGAMEAILKAIECHPDNVNLQTIGASSLGKIAGEVQLLNTVTEVGKISKLVSGTNKAALSQASIDKLVIQCNLLANLALINDNVGTLVKHGAVASLMTGLAAAGNLPEGIKRDQTMAACVAGLFRLSKDPTGAAQFLAAGGLAAVLHAAVQNPHNGALAESVMMMVSELASNPANIAKIISVIGDIINLAKAHLGNEAMLAAACKALGLLAVDDASIRAILANDGASIVVESILANLGNPAQLLEGLQVLATLAIDDDAVAKIVAAGGIDAILFALKKYPENAPIIEACISALCKLIINEEIAQSIGEKGGIPLLLTAARTHYQVETLEEANMALLDSLGSLQFNIDIMLEEDLRTVELVQWLAETAYPQNKNLTEAAGRLLANLIGNNVADLLITDEAGRLDLAQCEIMISKLKSGELNPQQIQMMMESINELCQNPENARIFVKAGGLQAVANVMKDYRDNEQIYYAAASAFATLTDHAGAGEDIFEVIDENDYLETLCHMLEPNNKFASPMNLADLTKAIGAVAALKLKPEQISEMAKNSQTLSSLMKILCESDDPLLLAQASRLLGKISNDEAAALLLSQLGNLRELIFALRKNINNTDFLKYGIYLLANLAFSDELKSQIGIEGGIQLILQVMQMYAKNENLIENCCYALANLSFDNEVNNSFIVACKGIQTLVTVMRTHTQKDDMLESAVCVLCNLCHNNDVYKDLIVKHEGASTIVETILNNFNALDLLLTCFRTLGNLACNPQNISIIIEAGGVQGIVAGLTVHNEEEAIIDVAIRVLTNLASELNDNNQRIMAQEGAVQAIVEVAINYAKDPEIEVAALGCLCNLARATFNASMIIKQGGTEAALKAVVEQPGQGELVAKAMTLIATLSLSINDIDRVLGAGATAGVVSCLGQYGSDPAVVVAGLTAIHNMAYNEKIAASMAKDGPTQAVLKCMEMHMSNPAILQDHYKALSSLCRNEGNAVAMAEAVYNRLVTQFDAHNLNEPFLCQAFGFLGNMCVHRAASDISPKTKIVKATLDILRTHKNNPNVLARGLRGLENMAYGAPPTKDAMKADGVIVLCQNIIDSTPFDNVKAGAQQVIDVLNRTELNTTSIPFVTMKAPTTMNKSAKELFGDVAQVKAVELSRETRNFLLAGALLMKHSNSAAPRSRHVYVTADLKFLVWKDPKKPLDPQQRMKVFKMKSVELGRCTKQLQRKNFRGVYLAKEECAFAVHGRERTIDLETATTQDRDKWKEALETLMRYSKAQKEKNSQFNA